MAFDQPVAPGGYAWWYVDALSDDQQHALTLIAFVGSVFSPYYARQRRRNLTQAAAEQHCAINVALYGKQRRWSMTERARVQRDADHLAIGPSQLSWNGSALTIDVNEIGCPLPKRISGQIVVHPQVMPARTWLLDPQALHQWQPIAPVARIEVQLTQPQLRWRGAAYLDHNHGAVPLEQSFLSWHWSRATLAQQHSAVLYDVLTADQQTQQMGLRFDQQGQVEPLDATQLVQLPRSRWGIQRQTRADGPTSAQLVQTLEDTPFYARSLINTQLGGESIVAMHESLSLTRFNQRLVQWMLPFRMPRYG